MDVSVVAGALFSIGVFGVLSRKSAVAILMSMSDAQRRQYQPGRFLALQRPGTNRRAGVAAFVFVVAAAEAAVGLAIIIAVYRNRRSTIVEDVDLLKW